jgi:hypothetical protein
MNEKELKQSALRMFNNVHKDNSNKEELLRCIKVCNGAYMATTGVQLGEKVVNDVYDTLKKELSL